MSRLGSGIRAALLLMVASGPSAPAARPAPDEAPERSPEPVNAPTLEPAIARGASEFEVRCSICHGNDGAGTDRAPPFISFVASHSDAEVAALIRNGRGAMPAHAIADPVMDSLIKHLHVLASRAGAATPTALMTLQLADGSSLRGTILNQSRVDLQLSTAEGVRLLEREGSAYRSKPLLPRSDWPRYDGSFSGNRFSDLSLVNTSNVGKLQLAWILPLRGAPRLEATPVVVNGVMYVTAVNAAYALDATSGRLVWSFSRPATPGLLGEAAGGANRGVAIAGRLLYLLTDNAHLLALDKNTGALQWDMPMTDWPRSQYSATGAPLTIGTHVLVGVAGGEEGARGFLASYDAESGRREWQFWTVPQRGDPLARTWIGTALEHGCGATWMSGSYDPTLDLVYWAVGNPCPDYNGAERLGDNLYTDSVLALHPATGKLQWYFQFTPHDTADWDAAEPLLLIDAVFQGQPRQLLAQANRNGFFFLLDRTTGKLLRAKPFVKTINWATGYSIAGKPMLMPDYEPTVEGGRVCPGSATNWMSASYSAGLGLFFVAASDRCKVTTLKAAPFEMGKRYLNGSVQSLPEGSRSIRALDLASGRIVWDYEQTPGPPSSSGTLATAGDLVFAGEDSGLFTALEARTGRPLWHFAANDNFRASPMTYMVGGRQYISIATSGAYLSFALPAGRESQP